MNITIEKIVYPGKSLGRGEDGIATFVEGGLAGEVVEVSLTKNKKTFREGNITRIITRSPERISPRCPSFGECGGCSFQHAQYDRQLSIKEAYVRELLDTLCPVIQPIIRSPMEWGYRNKMEFSFSGSGGKVIVGLHKRGAFDEYIPVPPCYIADADFMPVAEKVLSFVRSSGLPAYNKKTHSGFYRHLVLRKGKNTGQLLVNLVTAGNPGINPKFFAPLLNTLKGSVTSFFWTVNTSVSDAVLADKLMLLHGPESIDEKMTVRGKEYAFSISPFSFFQTNTLAAERLYEIAASFLDGRKSDVLLDLYCGTGTIGIALAPYVGSVLGVEQVSDAVANAEENKRRNSLTNISFLAASVEKWLKHGERGDFNAVVLDPPRGGISSKVVNFIKARQPDKIVYVSCNPATLGRDLKLITETAGYLIKEAVPVDMFPHTYHVEAVVSLRKK